jgi:hypothetical protein
MPGVTIFRDVSALTRKNVVSQVGRTCVVAARLRPRLPSQDQERYFCHPYVASNCMRGCITSTFSSHLRGILFWSRKLTLVSYHPSLAIHTFLLQYSPVDLFFRICFSWIPDVRYALPRFDCVRSCAYLLCCNCNCNPAGVSTEARLTSALTDRQPS